MIQEFVRQWDEKKDTLSKYFEKYEPEEYIDVVRSLFTHVIDGFNIDNLVEIDHGDYQGTQIYLISIDTYQPGVSEYVYTSNYYGSCSGCDLLQSIQVEDDAQRRVSQYMQLALNLLQDCKYLV